MPSRAQPGPPLGTWDVEGSALLARLAERTVPRLSAEEADGLATRHGLDTRQLLRRLVPLAEARAHAPLSRYRAGAVGRGPSGALYLGANLELPEAPISATLHAEQTAAFQAFLGGELGLTHLAIGGPPCGLCRQFLLELPRAADLEVILPGVEAPLSALLPEPFAPASLGVTTPWMESRCELAGLLHDAPSEALPALARAAAAASHAPYTGLHEGVVLVDVGGGVHVGARVESAAFNPTLTAIGAALSAWNLAGRPALARALHARPPGAPRGPGELTAQLLRGLGAPPPELVDLEGEPGA